MNDTIDPRPLLALTALLIIALAGALLREMATRDTGLLLLGVSIGIFLHEYLRSRR